RDVLADPSEQKSLLEGLIRQHFGADIEPPARPTKATYETVVEGGKKVKVLRIGQARLKVPDPASLSQEQREKIPTVPEGMAPIGPQWDFIESLALRIEAKQPAVIVGETGLGKTDVGMRWLMSAAGRPVLESSCNASMTEEHLFVTTKITKD